MGEEVTAYCANLRSDDVLYQLRAVQAVVTHLETFPAEIARGACMRAMYFGSYGYKPMKNILRRALIPNRSTPRPQLLRLRR